MFIHDSKKFSPMIREASGQYDIDKVYADKAHDNKRSFQLLDGLNIEPAVNIRNNAPVKTKQNKTMSIKKRRSIANQKTRV
jgi:hypothetical protein